MTRKRSITGQPTAEHASLDRMSADHGRAPMLHGLPLDVLAVAERGGG